MNLPRHLFRAAALVAIASFATTLPAQQPGATAVRVPVVAPERKTIRRTIEQPAHLEAFEQTPLYARIAGYLASIDVDMGDRIQGPKADTDGRSSAPGQTLAVIAAPELEATVEQKKALVAQAEADVVQARAGIKVADATLVSARSQRKAAEASVVETKAHVDRYQSELQRFITLQSRAAVDMKLVDETREKLNAAEAVRTKAEAAVEQVDAGITESQAAVEKAKADLVAVEARVRVAQAEAAQAEAMWNYHVIHAPFDGVVTQRRAHTGHLVQPGSTGEPIVTVVRTDKVRVFLDVPETDAPLVDVGDEVNIRFPALGGQVVSAKVTRTSWVLDRSARTLSAEVEIANDDGKLRPGMYAYATVVLAEHPAALVLPATAVFADKTDSYCACIESGHIVRKKVGIGLRSGGDVEIVEGLTGGEQVVRANAAALPVGQAVEPVLPPPATPAR
jgi:RND family efflux transporter MFP subunit